MTADAPTNTASTGATAAFLRGVERRAALLAQCQCGSEAKGDAAVAAALRAFTRIAPDAPMAVWPVRFWSLLLAAPDLRRSADDAAWPSTWAPLAQLGNGPRAALLLRLVAGLEMDDAAAALGVSSDAYRTALQRAIPYREDGTPDRDAWLAWVAAVRVEIEGMQPDRLGRLHAPPQATRAMPGRTTEAVDARSAPAGRRWRPIAVAAGVAIAVGAFAYVGWRGHWFGDLPFRGDLVRTAPLPPADPPVARYDADLGAWTHRDFLAIADPQGVARAGDLPFFAWYAALLAVQPAADAQAPASSVAAPVPAAVLAAPATLAMPAMPATSDPAPAFVAPSRTRPLAIPRDIALPASTSSVIARIPAPMQDGMRDQATLWHAWTFAQRQGFAQRAKEWDAQPRATQATLRERYNAWRRLDPVAAEAVENAVQAFARRTPEEQAALRAQFDALEPLAQRGWLLGPAIGVDYPKLQPLLAQMPEAQHAPMLRALRRMTSAERADLSVLAQRVPPHERADLVRALLSTADERRGAWLQMRLAQ
ncbi:DUF3106 domain-containing protein [Lysobacter sp. A6]|uniref:DUF3106 domain-containing protein n=1 Tax=Noviluteimonas lactosilytica TaxID=2888523 RepID=A0ABS8JHJ5_9GAMM|nr:DUF3106 domain-containing protein [Lysobacter lactosilyticus]MCC8362953.1 DUF3106 domain-containing protein [Lysobacter lactosilyticus]